MDGLVCGGPVAITPRLFTEADDRWDCTVCPSWGTISERKDEPQAEQDERRESDET